MVSDGKFSVRFTAPFVFCGEFDIDGAKHRENEGLEQTHQQLKEVEWKWK